MTQHKNAEIKANNAFFSIEFFRNLILLLIGFILTTLIGSWLTDHYQNRANKRAYQNTFFDAERKTAKEIFEEVTTAIDERIYYAQLVNDAHTFQRGNEVPAEKWNNYVASMGRWNININKRCELVQLYFGPASKQSMLGIHTAFIALNKKLNMARTGNNDALHSEISAAIGNINKSSYALGVKLITLIQQDAIGKIPSIKNADH